MSSFIEGVENRNYKNIVDEPDGVENPNFIDENVQKITKPENYGIENKNFENPDDGKFINDAEDGEDLTKTKNRNVAILGLAFMLIFAGFLTSVSTGETIIRSYEKRTGTNVNGFIVQGINFLTTVFVGRKSN
jgi:hypothetical protein